MATAAPSPWLLRSRSPRGSSPRRRGGSQGRRSRSPLAMYGVDLTRRAGAGGLDRVIGRGAETRRVQEILLRRNKNNPLLVGDAGVGKTAIVEGLAQRIVAGRVPPQLLEQRLITLDLAAMIAGARYRGEFEQRIKLLLKEVAEAKDVILFIDEIHSILGAGGVSGTMDAAGLLKPALARGQIRVIGATTWREYRRFFVRDATLQRRFQTVAVEEPDPEDARAVLEGLRETYEEFHGLPISDEAIEAAVRLSDRYVPDRQLPDKAIDLIDEALARRKTDRLMPPDEIKKMRKELTRFREKRAELAVDGDQADLLAEFAAESRLREKLIVARRRWYRRLQQSATPIDEKAIAEVVAGATGINLADLTATESGRYLELETRLRRSLVGQEQAAREVANSLKRAAAGLKARERPIGVLLLAGPSGVGKSELSELLAEFVSGSRDKLVRIDMSELSEPFSVSRLIGAPPGYVGYDEAGRLTEAVRREPYCVVLFDEIEKAHPQVLSLLLQIMDTGALTDAAGRKADFRHAIVLLSTTAGGRGGGGIGFAGSGPGRIEPVDPDRLAGELRRRLAPEFVNRIDRIVPFRELAEEDYREIARRLLAAVARRADGQGARIEFSGAVLEALIARALEAGNGARPLRAAVEHEIEEQLAAAMIAAGQDGPRDFEVGYADGRFEVTESAAEPV
ncbi:MAG: ATP-dependent Clp protease ATP-binding subunit [Chloroflexi bacterium]|nr:ATP-dependent Clp protease ATP-binding subunit [Chloroflexota bacterium]